jgi:hypothetical protein
MESSQSVSVPNFTEDFSGLSIPGRVGESAIDAALGDPAQHLPTDVTDVALVVARHLVVNDSVNEKTGVPSPAYPGYFYL